MANEREKALVAEAYASGYMAGHNDTVEGVYGDPEWCAEDFAEEFDYPSPQQEPEGNKRKLWIFFNKEGPYGASFEPAPEGSMTADPECEDYWQQPAILIITENSNEK